MDDKSLDPRATPPEEPVPDTEPSTAPAADPETTAPETTAPEAEDTGMETPETAAVVEAAPSEEATADAGSDEPTSDVATSDVATPSDMMIPDAEPESAAPAASGAETSEVTIPDAVISEEEPAIVAAAEPESAVSEAVAPDTVALVVEAVEQPASDEPDSDLSKPVTSGHDVEYPRFRLMARIEHMTLLISFTILCLTGLPQKFPFSPLSQWIVGILGGIEFIRMVHRWAAIVLILGSVYHLLTSAYRLFVKHEDMRMLPDLKDATDLRDTVGYNLGFIDEPPKMGKFNFGEKFEYWAVVWGTGVMIITGFILWNPIAATRFLPGALIPVAKEAHGWEAVLAAVSIVIWHLYNVLVKHRNLSMFTGAISHKIMEEEHALELDRLDEGGDPWRVVPPDVLARRRRIFLAVASVVAVLALALVVWMFTFEDTAIIVPRATQEIFVPLATPVP